MPWGAFIGVLSLFLSTSVYAQKPHELWFSGDGLDKHKVTLVEDCLSNTVDKKLCIGITRQACTLNQGACAHQEMAAWSFVGAQWYQRLAKEQPQQAASLKGAQTAWYDYARKECQYAGESARYEGKEQPSFYWIAYNNCLAGLTANRTILLYNNATH